VAEVAWGNLPGRFGTLNVRVDHLGTRSYSYTQLEALFGPRPSNLDDKSISQELSGAALTSAALLGLLALVVLLTAVFVFVSITRRKRRQADRQDLMMRTLPPQAWSWAAPGYSLPGEDEGDFEVGEGSGDAAEDPGEAPVDGAGDGQSPVAATTEEATGEGDPSGEEGSPEPGPVPAAPVPADPVAAPGDDAPGP
jgi:hypothetical protein